MLLRQLKIAMPTTLLMLMLPQAQALAADDCDPAIQSCTKDQKIPDEFKVKKMAAPDAGFKGAADAGVTTTGKGKTTGKGSTTSTGKKGKAAVADAGTPDAGTVFVGEFPEALVDSPYVYPRETFAGQKRPAKKVTDVDAGTPTFSSADAGFSPAPLVSLPLETPPIPVSVAPEKKAEAVDAGSVYDAGTAPVADAGVVASQSQAATAAPVKREQESLEDFAKTLSAPPLLSIDAGEPAVKEEKKEEKPAPAPAAEKLEQTRRGAAAKNKAAAIGTPVADAPVVASEAPAAAPVAAAEPSAPSKDYMTHDELKSTTPDFEIVIDQKSSTAKAIGHVIDHCWKGKGPRFELLNEAATDEESLQVTLAAFDKDRGYRDCVAAANAEAKKQSKDVCTLYKCHDEDYGLTAMIDLSRYNKQTKYVSIGFAQRDPNRRAGKDIVNFVEVAKFKPKALESIERAAADKKSKVDEALRRASIAKSCLEGDTLKDLDLAEKNCKKGKTFLTIIRQADPTLAEDLEECSEQIAARRFELLQKNAKAAKRTRSTEKGKRADDFLTAAKKLVKFGKANKDYVKAVAQELMLLARRAAGTNAGGAPLLFNLQQFQNTSYDPSVQAGLLSAKLEGLELSKKILALGKELKLPKEWADSFEMEYAKNEVSACSAIGESQGTNNKAFGSCIENAWSAASDLANDLECGSVDNLAQCTAVSSLMNEVRATPAKSMQTYWANWNNYQQQALKAYAASMNPGIAGGVPFNTNPIVGTQNVANTLPPNMMALGGVTGMNNALLNMNTPTFH